MPIISNIRKGAGKPYWKCSCSFTDGKEASRFRQSWQIFEWRMELGRSLEEASRLLWSMMHGKSTCVQWMICARVFKQRDTNKSYPLVIYKIEAFNAFNKWIDRWIRMWVSLSFSLFRSNRPMPVAAKAADQGTEKNGYEQDECKQIRDRCCRQTTLPMKMITMILLQAGARGGWNPRSEETIFCPWWWQKYKQCHGRESWIEAEFNKAVIELMRRGTYI